MNMTIPGLDPVYMDIFFITTGLFFLILFIFLIVKISILKTKLNSSIEENSEKSELIGFLREKIINFEKAQTRLETQKQFLEESQGLLNLKLSENAQKELAQILVPLKTRIEDFQKKVDSSFGEEAKERFALTNEIKRIVETNEKMVLKTEQLTKALKGDVKIQGNWGELLLERILESSGLRKNEDYILQGSGLGLADLDGRRQKPDVILNLPENKHVIIDAKVSLTAYERFSATEEDSSRALYLKQFLLAVKRQIDELAERGYEKAPGMCSPEFVLMFMPIEAAYHLAVQHDRELHHYAWEKRVVLVSVSTLFATLKIISSIWRLELQNKNALEIAKEGGALYDKFVNFVEDLEKVGEHIEKTNVVYNLAMNKLKKGKGNLVHRTEKMKLLGAKATKQLVLEEE